MSSVVLSSALRNRGLAVVRWTDYAWTVLAKVLSWTKDRGKITVNPCEKGGRLYKGTRVDFIWTLDDEAAFLKRTPAHLHLPLLLAPWTGQRQGDLLRLSWSAYDGSDIRLRQSKTGIRVQIPAGAPAKATLDAAAKHKHGPIILLNTDGRPWTPDGFRSSWGQGLRQGWRRRRNIQRFARHRRHAAGARRLLGS